MKEVRIRESHDCDKIHPKMNHLEWVAQNKDAKNQDKDPVGPQHEEILVEDMSLAPKGKGRKAAKALYKEDEKEDIPKGSHKMPDGTIMKDSEHKKEKTNKEETEWQKSKKQDREAQKRSEKQHDEREARYQRQKAGAKSIIKKRVRKIVTARGTFYAKEEVVDEGSLSPTQKAAREKTRPDRVHGGSPGAARAAGFGTGGDHQQRGQKKTATPHKYGSGVGSEGGQHTAVGRYGDKARPGRISKMAYKKEDVGVEEGAGFTGGVRPEKPPHMRPGQTWKKIALIKKELELKKAKQAKEEVETEVYKPNYGQRPFEPKNPKPHPAGITGPHNYPVNGDEKKKERDALVKAVAKSPKQQALKKKQDAAKKEEVEESNLPPHLAKFFDKKGNLKPDAAKRMAAGKVKRKSKDVTPKGYGPNEEVEVDETVGLGGWKGSGIEKMPPVDKKTGKYVTGKTKIIRITKKGEKALKKGDQKLSITAKGRAAVEEVEIDEFLGLSAVERLARAKKKGVKIKAKTDLIKQKRANVAAKANLKAVRAAKEEVEVDEVLRGTPGFYKKKGTPNLDASRAAAKAKREKDNPKKFRTPQQAHLDKKPGWDRFPEEVEEASVTGITVSKKMAGTTVPPKQAPRSQRMDKGKNLLPAPGWTTRKSGKKSGQMTTSEYDPTIGKEVEEVDEQEMMQLKHKKSGQVMRMARKVYQKQAHIQRERGWVPDSKQPHMRGGSAIQHSYEPEGDTELQEMDFKVKIKGLPIFYVPGRSVGEIRAHMRKNLKRPQDVEWVERTTVAQKKKDFRLRAQDKDSG